MSLCSSSARPFYAVPVLMILAKQPAWTSEYENFARGLAPDLDYQTWAGVSHFIMMEKPNEFNAALMAFLEKNKERRFPPPPLGRPTPK